MCVWRGGWSVCGCVCAHACPWGSSLNLQALCVYMCVCVCMHLCAVLFPPIIWPANSSELRLSTPKLPALSLLRKRLDSSRAPPPCAVSRKLSGGGIPGTHGSPCLSPSSQESLSRSAWCPVSENHVPYILSGFLVISGRRAFPVCVSLSSPEAEVKHLPHISF